MSELNPEVQERLHKAESENEVWKVLVIWYDARANVRVPQTVIIASVHFVGLFFLQA